MSEPKKLWAVTLRREVEVYVSAETREDAERTALWDADDELGDADAVCDGSRLVTSVPDADRGILVYGDPERTVGDVLDGVPSASERRQAWEREVPETLADLIAWIARQPSEDARFPYHAAISGGAAAGDGVAVLAVDGASAPHGEWSSRAEVALRKVAEQAIASATCSAVALASWLSAPSVVGEVPRIGTVLGVPINRALVARTVGHAARITGGAVIVSVGAMGTMWSGDGWRAAVMPLRLAGLGPAPTGPALEVEP